MNKSSTYTQQNSPPVKELAPSLLNSLKCDKDNIYAAVRSGGTGADAYSIGLVDEYYERCVDYFEPRAGYCILDNPRFDTGSSELVAGGQVFKLGRTVTSFLGKSTSVAVFAATCGDGIEKLSRELVRNGDILESFIVDLIGSEFAGAVAESVYKEIETEAQEKNLRVTDRYSPGYCNWPVSDQNKLFSLLSSNTFGIRLTTSSFMVPVKSVSGLVGLGKHVMKLGYTCSICPEEACLHRNTSAEIT